MFDTSGRFNQQVLKVLIFIPRCGLEFLFLRVFNIELSFLLFVLCLNRDLT